MKIIFIYCFLNVFYLRDNTFYALEAQSIIDHCVIDIIFEY